MNSRVFTSTSQLHNQPISSNPTPTTRQTQPKTLPKLDTHHQNNTIIHDNDIFTSTRLPPHEPVPAPPHHKAAPTPAPTPVHATPEAITDLIACQRSQEAWTGVENGVNSSKRVILVSLLSPPAGSYNVCRLLLLSLQMLPFFLGCLLICIGFVLFEDIISLFIVLSWFFFLINILPRHSVL